MERRRKHLCDICKKHFQFQSKLKRHLDSKSHRILATRTPRHRGTAAISDDSANSLSDMSEADTEGSSTEDAVPPALSPTVGMSSDSAELSDVDDHVSTDFTSDLALFPLLDIQDQLPASFQDAFDYHPFASKEEAVMYLLNNGLKPVSESVMKFAIFASKQLSPGVPSLTQLKAITLPQYTPPEKCHTSSGTPFYVRKPSTILTECFANKTIAEKVKRYPVIGDAPYKEIYEADEWVENPCYYSPMAIGNNGKYIFAGDIVSFRHDDGTNICAKVANFVEQRSSGQIQVRVYLIPEIATREGEECYLVIMDVAVISVEQITSVITESPPFTKANTCIRFPDSQEDTPLTDQQWEKLLEVHPTKQNELPVYTVPIILYSDDTSGNRSKKWNKFDLWALLLAGLPRSENAKMENIHLIGASNQVGALEMADPIVNDLITLESDGIEVYDAHLKRNVLIFAKVIAILCDNGRSTQLLNLCGGSAKKYCRMCLADREVSPHVLGKQRSKEEVLGQIGRIQLAKNETTKKDLRTKYGVKEGYNPLFKLKTDPFRCTPVECLHTLLLGPYKYLVRHIMSKLSATAKNQIEAKLRAFPLSGLPCSPPVAVCRHYGSLHGRDFKVFAQVGLFVLWEHLTSEQRELWLSLSKVFKLAYCEWFTADANKYADLVCKQFVEKAKAYDPKLMDKQKIHLLLHLPENIRQFGPTFSFNTERCEHFNSILRDYNIHGNRKACSRDVVTRFAKVEALRLLTEESDRNRCGAALNKLLNTPEVIHFLYGTPYKHILSHKEIYQSGTLRKMDTQCILIKDLTVTVGNTETTIGRLTQTHFNYASCIPTSTSVTAYKAVVDQTGFLVNQGDNVAFGYGDKVDFGELKACFLYKEVSYCILQPYTPLVSNGDPILSELECPLLQLEDKMINVKADQVKSAQSIVHECTAECKCISTTADRIIERETTQKQGLHYKHDYNNCMYSLNIFCCQTLYL